MRSVIGWALIGATYQNGYRIPGFTRLDMSDGSFMHYTENTPLDTALNQIQALGVDTTEARAKTDHWVKTGEGATFALR